jgi:crossover junction endodeoxyribonuclease RuvC
LKLRIGIDPGISGAVAVLDENLACVAAYEMPTMKMGKKQQVNAAELARLLRIHTKWLQHDPTCVTAYLELVAAMPGQGVTGMFNFGMSYGVVQGVLAALDVPTELVTPGTWKKRASLVGKEKDMARTKAQMLYPTLNLGRKKDIGRADALLIARFSGPGAP